MSTNMKEIHLFKPTFNKQEILAQISECLDKSWTGIGYKTIEFEEKFKEYTGIPHAHFLNSATSGLHLALEILKRNEYNNHLVVTTPLTFISDTAVIYHANQYTYFVDTDEYLCIDPIELRKTFPPVIMAPDNPIKMMQAGSESIFRNTSKHLKRFRL